MTYCKDILKRIGQQHLLNTEDKDHLLTSIDILCELKAPAKLEQ